MSQDQELQPPMGFPARLIGIFTAPGRVFRDLAGRPTWLAPLLMITLSIAAMNIAVLFTKTGEAAMRQELQEKMPQNVAPDMVDRQLAVTKFAVPISIVVFVPLFTFILAGVVYLVFSIVLGGEATFRQTFSAYCHTGLIGIVGALVGTLMIFLKGTMKSSTALTAFLPFLEEKSLAFKIFQMLDLFVIWQLAVMSIGMGILNQLGTRKAATTIFSIYAVLVVLIAVIRQFLF